jgi:hypothetical protein
MGKIVQSIEWSGRVGDPLYLRFSHEPVNDTESFAHDEVTVDLDVKRDVVGIEMLSTGPEEFAALADLARSHGIALASLLSAKKYPRERDKHSTFP